MSEAEIKFLFDMVNRTVKGSKHFPRGFSSIDAMVKVRKETVKFLLCFVSSSQLFQKKEFGDGILPCAHLGILSPKVRFVVCCCLFVCLFVCLFGLFVSQILSFCIFQGH
jgi:hypothetical protein